MSRAAFYAANGLYDFPTAMALSEAVGRIEKPILWSNLAGAKFNFVFTIIDLNCETAPNGLRMPPK